MSVLVLALMAFTGGSLDSLDASLTATQAQIAFLEEEEAAIATILEAIHQHLMIAREYYNELALEEARILQQLSGVSNVFTSENQLREELVERLSSYLLYLYSHRNLGGVGSFFAEGGFSRMLRRQAYVDYLASKAAGEVFMLSISHDSLGSYRDSLEVLLVNVQNLRAEMVEIQSGIYEEEARQASIQNQLMGRIAAAKESLAVMEETRISRATFVTQLGARSTPSNTYTPLMEPQSNSFMENGRGSISWPATGQVVRRFGIEVHPEYGTETTSDGITVVTPPGQPIQSSAAGAVLWAREFLSMGQMVVVDHQDGYYTVYGYLSQVLVSPGDDIEINSQIGKAGPVPDGQPGYYFEIRRGGIPVNPEEYLE